MKMKLLLELSNVFNLCYDRFNSLEGLGLCESGQGREL